MFVGGRRLGLAFVAALMALGAVGCNGSSDSPAVLPPISTTPTPSQSTAAAESPKAAAIAVVREYFKAKNEAVALMDTAPLHPLLTADCPCRRFLASVRQTRRAHHAYFGSSHLRAATPTDSSATAVQILATYDTTRGGTKDDSGHVLFSGPARHNLTALFEVQLVENQWLIADIASVSKGRT